MARPRCMYQGHQRVDTLRVTAWSGVPLQTLCRVDKLVVMSLDNKALWKVMQGQALTCGYGALWFVLSMSYQTNRPRMGPTDMRCLYSYVSTVHVELVQHATIRGKYSMPAGNPLGYFRGVTISASRFTTLVSFGFRKRTRSEKKKKKEMGTSRQDGSLGCIFVLFPGLTVFGLIPCLGTFKSPKKKPLFRSCPVLPRMFSFVLTSSSPGGGWLLFRFPHNREL